MYMFFFKTFIPNSNTIDDRLTLKKLKYLGFTSQNIHNTCTRITLKIYFSYDVIILRIMVFK